MSLTRVRVRRERPTALAWALALAVTMLVVYLLTLQADRTEAVESVSAAPRVTREIRFEALEWWCVSMAECASAEEARLLASGYTARGAAGCVARMGDGWNVLGAAYDGEREARRIAERLRTEEGLSAEVLPLGADPLRLRITAPEKQIEAIAAADATLRAQERQLGQLARQLDRGEAQPEGAKTLCALASDEAEETCRALKEIPGAAENRLCAGLIEALDALSRQQDTFAHSGQIAAASLSGMARCIQVETLLRHRELLQAPAG